MLVVIWRDQSTGYATLSTALHTQELSLTLGNGNKIDNGTWIVRKNRTAHDK